MIGNFRMGEIIWTKIHSFQSTKSDELSFFRHSLIFRALFKQSDNFLIQRRWTIDLLKQGKLLCESEAMQDLPFRDRESDRRRGGMDRAYAFALHEKGRCHVAMDTVGLEGEQPFVKQELHPEACG